MSQTTGNSREDFEETLRSDLHNLRNALLGPSEYERQFLTNLSRSRLAEIQFSSDLPGQSRYRLRLWDSGQEQIHSSTAKIVDSPSGRRDLALDDFPGDIEPLGLLYGDFDSEPFSEVALRFRAKGFVIPRENDFLSRDGRQDVSPSLAAASDDEDDWSTLLDDLDPHDVAVDDRREVLGERKDDRKPFGLAAESSDSKSERSTGKWHVDWPLHGDLTLEYQSSAPRDAEELPGMVSVEYEDHGGSCRSFCFMAHFVRRDDGDGSSRWWRHSIPQGELPHPGPNVDVKLSIRPMRKWDVVALEGGEDLTRRPWNLDRFLASRDFTAFVGQRIKDQTYFREIPDGFLTGELKSGLIQYAKNPEAKDVDADPFHKVSELVLQFRPALMRRALSETGDWHTANDLVQESLLPCYRDPEKYLKIYHNPQSDQSGSLGGREGIRRKLFNNLQGKIGDFLRKKNRQLPLASDSLPDSHPIDEFVDQSLYGSERHTTIQQVDSRLDAHLLQRYLTQRERLVLPLMDRSVNEIIAGLHKQHGYESTPDKCGTDVKNIRRKASVLTALHRLYCEPYLDTPLLTESEFQFASHLRLIGGSQRDIIRRLRIDKETFDCYKSRVDTALEITCVAIELLCPANRRVKDSRKPVPGSFRAKIAITQTQFWMILEWLIRPSDLRGLAATFQMEEASVAHLLRRLGSRLHAQILIDRGELGDRAGDLLRYWAVECRTCEDAVQMLEADVARNKEEQARKKRGDLERKKRDDVKKGKQDLPRFTPDLDLDGEVAAIHKAWETETPVPVEYRLIEGREWPTEQSLGQPVHEP